MNYETILSNNSLTTNKINESELFTKYNSCYKSVFLDCSLHTFCLLCSFYLLWLFRYSWLSICTIPFMMFMLSRTVIMFHDCYNNLKLKLYDEKNNKYIRLDEVENYKYTSKICYYINLILYALIQLPVILCKLINPFCDVNNLHNNSLSLLDNWFLQINFLNNYPICNVHIALANHSSSCDGYLRHKHRYKMVSIIKDALFYVPFLGQVFWLLNFIFIKRDDKNSRNNSRNKIIQTLNENTIVQLFPQGTRQKNKFFKNNEIVLKKGSMEIALITNVPIVLCYHNIGDRVDDENALIHFHKKVYAVCSNPIILPNEYSELPIEEKVDKLYKIIYDEFIRLEKIVLDKTIN